LIIRKRFFGNFRKIPKFLSRLPISFLEMIFWLGLRLRTTTNHKCQPEN